MTGAPGAPTRAAPPVPVRLSPLRVALAISGPAAIALMAWTWLGLIIDDMSRLPGLKALMMHPDPYSPVQLFGLFVMWLVMQSAMMLPTATTMLIGYARMQAADRAAGAGWAPVLAFAAGYLLAWSAFSLGAAFLQAWLTGVSAMSPMAMKTASGPLTAGVLIAAGIYQLTPLKQACLKQCRTPLGFLMTEWRNGLTGALSMGWRHGLFCIGCCWALMALLLVAGVMNPVWIVAITAYVLAEKVVPGMEEVSRLLGVVLIGAGTWIVV